MPRVALVLALATALAACGDDTVEFIPRSQFKAEPPKEAPPDPAFKPFPKDDPRVVTLPSGVKYLEIEPGTPNGKVVAENSTLRVSYKGWLENGVSFDSSFKLPNGSTEFPLNQMVAGWKEALPGMKEGAKRLLWIPAEKGYGAMPKAGIPPNSNLIFEVWLWNVIDAPKTADVDHAAPGR
jgi:FKBP-type peptidyl-prolyl cis-trans isomerase